jgi:hypothetical protein
MRKIAVMLIVVLAVVQANAQKVRLGLHASPQLTWLKPDRSFDKGKVRAGFEYGLITDIAFNDDANYGISTGVNLSLTGGNIEGPLNTNVKAKLQYVSIPVLLKLRTNKINDKWAVYGKFGTLVSFRYKAKADIINGIDEDTGINIAKKINTTDNPSTIKSTLFNFSLQVGSGVEYYVSDRTSILLGLYYNHGFLSVLNEKNTGSDATLSNLGLRMGIMF